MRKKFKNMQGFDKVMYRMDKAIKHTVALSDSGLYAGGLVLQAEAQKLTPVRTGNLKASASTRLIRKGQGRRGGLCQVGFSAHYAIYVHENLTAHHNNGQAKFLEDAMVTHEKDILHAIRSAMK
jgi:ornithine cyclodeaminase/alanine dehydrogenase-like protein (mu-crystallin family)